MYVCAVPGLGLLEHLEHALLVVEVGVGQDGVHELEQLARLGRHSLTTHEHVSGQLVALGGVAQHAVLGVLEGDAGGHADAARVGADLPGQLRLVELRRARLEQAAQEEAHQGQVVEREAGERQGDVGVHDAVGRQLVAKDGHACGT